MEKEVSNQSLQAAMQATKQARWSALPILQHDRVARG